MRAVATAWLVCVTCVSCTREEVVVSGDRALSELAVLVLQEARLPARLYLAGSPDACHTAPPDFEPCVKALLDRLSECLFNLDDP